MGNSVAFPQTFGLGTLNRIFSRLAESVSRVDDHQKNHSGEPERLCVGKDHSALQEHGEAPGFDRTEAHGEAEAPAFDCTEALPTGPSTCPGRQRGCRTDQAGCNKNPESGILLSLHVGDDVTRDREEARAEGHDQLVDVPPMNGTEYFAARSRFAFFFPSLLFAPRFATAESVFSGEIEFLSLYNFGHKPGIHVDAGFDCLITARPELAALVGYFYCFTTRQ
jgi:hypothetical protein